MVLFLASLPATEADWSKTELDEPLSIDGRINRDGSSFSFQLNEKGIPDEPVRIVAHLRSDIDAETGIPKGESEPLYDPETLVFNPSCDLVYIGAELLDISPDTTIYVDNNQQSTGIGSNIDLIKGATATLNIAYNPSFTHQKGVIWYVADGAKTFSDFEYSGGSSQCTITQEASLSAHSRSMIRGSIRWNACTTRVMAMRITVSMTGKRSMSL